MFEITIKDEVKTRLMIAETGKSLRQFAEYVGMSHAYLSQILNNRRNPSPKIAWKIANGLSVKVKDIFLIKTVDVNNQIK